MGRGFQKIDFVRGGSLGWVDVIDDNGSKRSELRTAGNKGVSVCGGVSNEGECFERMGRGFQKIDFARGVLWGG